eukprot:111414-Rhodomonas_salina.1
MAYVSTGLRASQPITVPVPSGLEGRGTRPAGPVRDAAAALGLWGGLRSLSSEILLVLRSNVRAEDLRPEEALVCRLRLQLRLCSGGARRSVPDCAARRRARVAA